LYCLSFSFGHCIVCLFPLAIVLSVFFLWPLYCLSFSFGHCIVCLFPLVIVLSGFLRFGTFI
jgi:predicted alpha/beta hydrolase